MIETYCHDYLNRLLQAIETNPSYMVHGFISRIVGMKIEAVGITAPIGTICKIVVSEQTSVAAEVIGFSNHTTYLMANSDMYGIKQGTKVIPIANTCQVGVGMKLLGRIIDATGAPLDHGHAPDYDEFYPLQAKPINPLERKRIAAPLDVGIRLINTLFTVGKGQRLGIFAGSGVGKSVLLSMMTKYTSADVVVVGLIGERGREVKEFIEENLGEKGLAKAVVVATPADTSPLLRVNGALLATTLAEYYRDRGLDVLLIIDSLTRFAQAQREISLSAGEMPATKGFTPSVFAKLAQLVERSGNGAVGQGSITAFYTVLIEGDDWQDPVGDHVRSLLDGHLLLSRELADLGHYPAVDIEKSISRVMPAITDNNHQQYAQLVKRLYSTYQSNKDMINLGMYQKGSDQAIDESLRYREAISKFLCQSIHECADMDASLTAMYQLFNPT